MAGLSENSPEGLGTAYRTEAYRTEPHGTEPHGTENDGVAAGRSTPYLAAPETASRS